MPFTLPIAFLLLLSIGFIVIGRKKQSKSLFVIGVILGLGFLALILLLFFSLAGMNREIYP